MRRLRARPRGKELTNKREASRARLCGPLPCRSDERAATGKFPTKPLSKRSKGFRRTNIAPSPLVEDMVGMGAIEPSRLPLTEY